MHHSILEKIVKEFAKSLSDKMYFTQHVKRRVKRSS